MQEKTIGQPECMEDIITRNWRKAAELKGMVDRIRDSLTNSGSDGCIAPEAMPSFIEKPRLTEQKLLDVEVVLRDIEFMLFSPAKQILPAPIQNIRGVR